MARARILVLDDEPRITSMITQILSDEGYSARGFVSAREALAALKAGERFDLLICDLGLGEMSGVDLYHALAASCPELTARTLFLTGGATSPKTAEFVRQMSDRCLHKPVSFTTLLARIERALAP